MDFYFQKAKLFAMETAKRSQEIANQAAKMSQELATETAKKSKELAIDVTKKAEELKAYAEELTPGIVATTKSSGPPPPPSEEELEEYGITPELREFVKGLTIKTFRDFPIEASDGGFRTEPGTEQSVDKSGTQDLTPWRERHAVLVLLTVKEISDFRYVLCPRRMNESRFWTIYFTLVKSQIDPYEAAASEKAAALAAKEKAEGSHQQGKEIGVLPAGSGQAAGVEAKRLHESGATKASKNADHDLDAYLMGALDSSDEGADGDDDDGFDVDFDQLVNSTAESDGEDEARSAADSSSKAGTKTKQTNLSPSGTKPGTSVAATTSEPSSDGELVELPDSESEQAGSRASVPPEKGS